MIFILIVEVEDTARKHFKGNDTFHEDFTSLMEKSVKNKPIIQLEKEIFLQQSAKRKEEQLKHQLSLKKKNNGRHEEKAEVLKLDFKNSDTTNNKVEEIYEVTEEEDKENNKNNKNTHNTLHSNHINTNKNLTNVTNSVNCAKCNADCLDNKIKSFKCGHIIHNVIIILFMYYL